MNPAIEQHRQEERANHDPEQGRERGGEKRQNDHRQYDSARNLQHVRIPRNANIAWLACAILLLSCIFSAIGNAQNSRWDYAATTITGSGNLVPILAIPGASVSFYTGCTSLPCSTYASVYNSATSTTACANTAQIVLNGTNACVSVADGEGNFGGWFLPGQYQYTITAFSQTYGPYSFTIGLNTVSTAVANLSGGALGSAPYQSAASTTAFLPSPTATGTYFYGWQPSGSAVIPSVINLASFIPALPISIANGGSGQTTGIAALNALGAASGTTPIAFGNPVTAPSVNGAYNAALASGSDIGAKINAVVTSCSGTPCPIHVPAGSYSFTTPIVLAANVNLYGAGEGVTNLLFTAGSGTAITAGVTASSVTIHDFSLSGTAETPSTSTYNGVGGITILGTNGTIYNMQVAHFWGSGLAAVGFGGTNDTLRDSDIEYTYFGVSCGSRGSTIKNNYISNHYSQAVAYEAPGVHYWDGIICEGGQYNRTDAGRVGGGSGVGSGF